MISDWNKVLTEVLDLAVVYAFDKPPFQSAQMKIRRGLFSHILVNAQPEVC